MPVPVIAQGLFEGISSLPYAWTIIKIAPWIFLLYILKTYFGGARNLAERNMHSKVVMITGATSGIGEYVAYDLASRGAQLVLLTQQPLTDPFLVDHIMDLRTRTGNELITAESVDLSSLHSIRTFATKWIDNSPPRRLDAVILCASTMTPKGADIQLSDEGLENNFAVNYLANFHLLSILSPALRSQPPDRDVRVVIATCGSYMGGDLPEKVPKPKILPEGRKKEKIVAENPSAAYSSSKLALMTFASGFQKHLCSYKRPDGNPTNTRVLMVDPGWCRTSSMLRYLTNGSLWGLGLYLLSWPFWWLVLKSPEQGAQSFLHAMMEGAYLEIEDDEMRLIKEVKIVKINRGEVVNEEKQKKLWEMSEKAIEALEREAAEKRAREKQENKLEEEEKKKKKEGDEEKKVNGGISSGSERQAGSRRARKGAKNT